MQRAIEDAEEELRRATVVGTAGGGVVRIELGGDWRVEKVEISEDVLRTPDKAFLEDSIRGALRDAHAKVTRLREDRRRQITGGLDLPGIL
jgi:DNA-binding YbaB/EbfC family protein